MNFMSSEKKRIALMSNCTKSLKHVCDICKSFIVSAAKRVLYYLQVWDLNHTGNKFENSAVLNPKYSWCL